MSDPPAIMLSALLLTGLAGFSALTLGALTLVVLLALSLVSLVSFLAVLALAAVEAAALVAMVRMCMGAEMVNADRKAARLMSEFMAGGSERWWGVVWMERMNRVFFFCRGRIN